MTRKIVGAIPMHIINKPTGTRNRHNDSGESAEDDDKKLSPKHLIQFLFFKL